MLFSDAVFNIFAGVFDVLNDVRQNVAVVLLFPYSIFPNLDAIILVRVLLCETYYSCPYAVMRNLAGVDPGICVTSFDQNKFVQ